MCQPDIGNLELEIGNINDTGFLQTWNSEQHKEKIEILNSRYNFGKCKNCRSIAFTQAIYEDEAGLLENLLVQEDPFV